MSEMRVHAKCSLGLFVELYVTFLWKQTCLIFVCCYFLFLFFYWWKSTLFLHIFPCWQQIWYVHVMIMAWCAVCRIAMTLPINIAQMKYSISLVYSKASMPANIFFHVCLSVWWSVDRSWHVGVLRFSLLSSDSLMCCVFVRLITDVMYRCELLVLDFQDEKFHHATCAAENKRPSSSFMPECIR